MNNIELYKDIMAFHPGYYIEELVEEMGISQNEFATRMGTTGKTLSKLINGQISISNDLAKKLSVMMGTSPEVWQNLQKAYDQKMIEIQQAKDFDAQINIMQQIDYNYFVKYIGLPSTRVINEKIANLCSFFKVSDLRIMLKPDFLVNYRVGTSMDDPKQIVNSRAWVQTAINVSRSIETKPFNAEKLKEHLPELRSMTVQSPEVFFPRMKALFSECGVAFVLLPHLKNSGVNGAVKWINEDRVVLAMNNRGLNADTFWFSLFHEIKHILQQKVSKVFITTNLEDMQTIDRALEEEADVFARNYLIPAKEFRTFSPSKYTSDAEIVSFANKIGIHPGIVAGRMQYDGIIKPNRCSQLKEKYYIEYGE